MGIKFDYSYAKKFIKDYEMENIKPYINAANRMLHERSGTGSEFTGWLSLPEKYDKIEYGRIKKCAQEIGESSDAFVVVGIGGSYLGARAVIEALTHSFHNQLPYEKRKSPEIYFAGNNISSGYLSDLMDILSEKQVSLNIISKSGTTTEPAITFRILKEYMEDRYGKKGASKRIYVTTDRERGALKKLSVEEGYESFVIPDDVGGRFSVLSAVGLLPIAVSGINTDELIQGASEAYEEYCTLDYEENACLKYAAARNILYRKGKTTEIMVNYEPSLHYFTEWWKQLYGESEGKDGKGIFPAGMNFTTDLHSMGQYIQDGLRNMFETVINIEMCRKSLIIGKDKDNLDGLNYISGKEMDYVNKKAMEGTVLAHTEGEVPNLLVNIPHMNENCLGNLIYFFEKACGISGYLLGVNPFDQPGVEAYKKNMFKLLGKPV
jgi:glucose-6-phosphate isomerase